MALGLVGAVHDGDAVGAVVERREAVNVRGRRHDREIADREHSRGDAPVPVLVAAGDLEAETRELRRRTKQLEQENEILRRATAYFARDVLPK